MTTHVRIVGTGLIGTSLGIALSRCGYAVSLSDVSPTAQRLAEDLGAGRGGEADGSPDVVVVAAPPDVTAPLVAAALRDWPRAVVTDVCSVKSSVLREISDAVEPAALERYVGGHPMAGRERSGAAAARADLFDGRTWVVVPHPSTTPDATTTVTRLARETGAVVVTMDPAVHDEAVAAVSHVPQVAASLVAAQLLSRPENELVLAGQGLRDVTRIAASDPRLWMQILAGNAAAVRGILQGVHERLGEVVRALAALESDRPEGALAVLSGVIADGNRGHAQIPGKHGASRTAYEIVAVVVPDRPGELARILHAVGEAGVNLEDLHLEHGLGQPVGLAEIAVLPAAAPRLRAHLTARGWRVHE